MKKTIIAVAALLFGAGAYAQDGEKVYLPEAEDWAIGIDATPFLSYFGNFIGGTDANAAPTWNFLTNNQTITGKYFTSADMAYRGNLRLGFGSASMTNMVADRASTATVDYPDLPDMVENNMKASFTNIGLSGGIEYRKGNGRLQGFYGGELGISFASSSESYTYGNELTIPSASNPVSVDAADDFGGNITTDPYGNAARVIESKNGSTFGIGVRGFIGAEYFVLPKLSIGGEFGWGLGFTSNGGSSSTIESVGSNTNGDFSVEQITQENAGSSNFGIDTDVNNSIFGTAGSIRLTFHF
tara:strand:- start:123086 stop:123982 length:897 start_codon:yes stop_codon:yes gene_type:complete